MSPGSAESFLLAGRKRGSVYGRLYVLTDVVLEIGRVSLMDNLNLGGAAIVAVWIGSIALVLMVATVVWGFARIVEYSKRMAMSSSTGPHVRISRRSARRHSAEKHVVRAEPPTCCCAKSETDGIARFG